MHPHLQRRQAVRPGVPHAGDPAGEPPADRKEPRVELVDVLRDEDQPGGSRNRPQFGTAMQRILASEANAIIVSKAGRSANAPWRNSLHTDPGGVVHCHPPGSPGTAARPRGIPTIAAPRSPPARIRSMPEIASHIIDSRTEKLDGNAEPPRHALASLTSANDPHGDARGPGDGEPVGASGAWIGVAVC
jgi:hypothetical protein